MAAALYAAGLAPWDVTMSDLVGSKASINRFCGLVFVGGFSYVPLLSTATSQPKASLRASSPLNIWFRYADVMDSAKGWAGVLKFNPSLWAQLQVDRTSLLLCHSAPVYFRIIHPRRRSERVLTLSLSVCVMAAS
jgi:hypothetical protein